MIEIRHSNSHSVKAKCHSNPRTTSGLVDACHVKAKFKTEIPSIVLVSQRQSHAIPRNTVLLKLLRLDHSPRQDNKHFDNMLTKRSTQTMILKTFFRNTCQTRLDDIINCVIIHICIPPKVVQEKEENSWFTEFASSHWLFFF